MNGILILSAALVVTLVFGLGPLASYSQDAKPGAELDKKVQKFLESHADDWHDMNVPESDGRLLYDLIIKNKYKRALEIGTSTGRSGIWMAWALSKTGGKLITIEIDESRYNEALKNFKEAGLLQYIDALLADAHELVPKLDGPFDFVFSDADKEWYRQYFIDVSPKLTVGGCFTAHNVSGRGRGSRGIREFEEYVKTRTNYETTFDASSYAGISISYKKAPD